VLCVPYSIYITIGKEKMQGFFEKKLHKNEGFGIGIFCAIFLNFLLDKAARGVVKFFAARRGAAALQTQTEALIN